jgi:hypothetical protein
VLAITVNKEIINFRTVREVAVYKDNKFCKMREISCQQRDSKFSYSTRCRLSTKKELIFVQHSRPTVNKTRIVAAAANRVCNFYHLTEIVTVHKTLLHYS